MIVDVFSVAVVLLCLGNRALEFSCYVVAVKLLCLWKSSNLCCCSKTPLPLYCCP